MRSARPMKEDAHTHSLTPLNIFASKMTTLPGERDTGRAHARGERRPAAVGGIRLADKHRLGISHSSPLFLEKITRRR